MKQEAKQIPDPDSQIISKYMNRITRTKLPKPNHQNRIWISFTRTSWMNPHPDLGWNRIARQLDDKNKVKITTSFLLSFPTELDFWIWIDVEMVKLRQYLQKCRSRSLDCEDMTPLSHNFNFNM